MKNNYRPMGELTCLFIDRSLAPELLDQLRTRLLRNKAARRRFTEFVVNDAKPAALGRVAKLLAVPLEFASCSGCCPSEKLAAANGSQAK